MTPEATTDQASARPSEQGHERRHYGGEHHRLSPIDRLGARVEHGLEVESLPRDPAFITRMLPILDMALAYFDPEIEGFERLPAHGPMLLVSNHSGGAYMPDFWALLRHWIRARGVDEPLHCLGFDLLFALPAIGPTVRRFGVVPASHATADRLLAAGHSVLVYPGGDEEVYRPWTERHRVDLRGRTGFARLALRHRVPVVPVVAHGSHDAIIVLSRGERLAQALGLDRLSIHILPIVAGPPWGVAPVPVPTWPLPTKVTVRVCEPLDWSAYGPSGEEDPTVVQRCYDEIVGRMQANLDDLAASRPHPLAARLRDPWRRGSRARDHRP